MKEIHVVGAAIMDGEKVLAAQRSIDMNTPLKWEFAGGKVENGESHAAALIREVREELGVRIEVKDFLATGVWEDGENRILLHVYEAEILEGKPEASEHAQLKWIELDGLGQLEWAEADIPACKELMRRRGASCWYYTRHENECPYDE